MAAAACCTAVGDSSAALAAGAVAVPPAAGHAFALVRKSPSAAGVLELADSAAGAAAQRTGCSGTTAATTLWLPLGRGLT